MSFGSFIHAPIRGDRGKRMLPDQSAYVQQDYLQDTRPEHEKKTHLVGKSDGRAAKFKVGFYRRPAAAIQPDAERRAQEEARAEISQRMTDARGQQLRELNTRNGNVLVPTPAEDPLFARRKRFPEREQAITALNHARQKVGASRFHTQLTSEEEAARQRLIKQRMQQQQQSVSVLGFGRADLPTGGVVDVFRALPPYTKDDLTSKPKMKPPPADSLAAQRSIGQLRIEDGSAQYGRRAGMHGRGDSVDPASMAGRAGAWPPVGGPASGRRANRGNRTSSGMAEAFSYTQVLEADAAARARRAQMPDSRPPVVAPQTQQQPQTGQP